MTEFFLERVLLPGGWASDVSVMVGADGRITGVRKGDRPPGAGASRLGTVVPGMANLHSHAFQRGMAGLSERRGAGEDSFWSWREVMYQFNDRLMPDQLRAIAELAYCEMLESGFTSVGEFHYLHHDPSGTVYEDPAEMGGQICAAAERAGIGLTLLPVFYGHGGFGPVPTEHGQRRFATDRDGYAALFQASARHVAKLPGARIGLAPHSLRAAETEEIRALAQLHPGPVHIHVAEQVREVEECVAHCGTRPVAHLLDTQDVDGRWCLVHATHMTHAEAEALAQSGAVAGLCPVTEANLGDGLFPAERFLRGAGRIGVGTDSNIRIDLADELRTLEYGRRLVDQRRNVLASAGQSTGRALFEAALRGGAQALDLRTSAIAVGERADFVVLDVEDPVLVARSDDELLDSWIFAGGARQVRDVWVAGRQVVEGGQAKGRESAASHFAQAMKEIRAQL